MALVIPPNRKRNCIWPLSRKGKGWATAVLARRYTAAMHGLLHTPLGSVITAPSFGHRFFQLRTQGISDEDGVIVAAELRGSVQRWIPDIEIVDVIYEADPDTEKLDVSVVWGIPGVDTAGASGSPERRFIYGPVTNSITI